jgi:hypothetical protein
LPGRFRLKEEKKKMEPTHAILAAAFALGLASQSEPVPAFYGCDVKPIEGTNAYQFVDATCPASVTGATADYVTEVRFIRDEEGHVIGQFEIDVSDSNR